MLTSRTDDDAARPSHLAEKVDLESRDDELAVDRQRDTVWIVKQLHARVLAADGKHGIGDVAVTVGVGEAQLLHRVERVILEAGAHADSFFLGHGSMKVVR